MDDWQVWVIAALVLMGAEMVAAGFWLACVAIGCLVAGLVSAFVPGLLGPTLSFAAGTLLSLVAVRPFLLRHIHWAARDVKTNVDALIGRIGTVSERIDPATGKGRVVVDGEDWRGASIMDTAIEAGDRVLVVRVEGTTLLVDKEG